MVQRRDPARTSLAILDAATQEVAEVGVAGARIDRIAVQAGVNKRMIYHYFGSKAGLVDAVFTSALSPLEALLGAETMESLPDLLQRLAADRSWRRIAVWEAFAADDALPVAGERCDAWQRLTNLVAQAKAAERLPGDLDSDQVLLALLALAVFPRAFPQYTRMITGQDPDSADFERAHQRFQTHLLNHLGRTAREPGKPRIRIKRTGRPNERRPETT